MMKTPDDPCGRDGRAGPRGGSADRGPGQPDHPRPAAAAAWLAGGIVGGALVGGAVANAANTTAEAAPGVTINGTTCYFTNRLVNPVTQSWVREHVCTTAAP